MAMRIEMKNAQFFTIDSLLAAGIVITAILLISNFYSVEQQKTNINYASQDLVRVFSAITIADSSNAYVKSLIISGQITNLNNTLIEQIGEFWAEGNVNLAKNFTKNLTEDIIPSNYGFSVLVNGEEIYSRNLPIKSALVSSRKLISGIAKAKPTQGYTARVLLNGIKSKKTSAYVYFGGYEGDGNLTKTLILPSDIVSINSSYLELDVGNNFTLYINGIFSGSYYSNISGNGNLLADKWNISNAYLSNFVPGTNTINIYFPATGKNYVAGGFLRVTYVTSSFNDTQTPGYEKILLPGIDGFINLYSSIYFPSKPGYMNVSLHFNSPYPIYLTFGNQTVYKSDGSIDDQSILLNNSNLSATVDYSLLGQKNLPLRLGLRIANITSFGTKADSVLITDRTGSMNACDVLTNCTAGLCDSNPSGGCHDQRDNVAKKTDKTFIDTILSTKGNNVGLVGFGTDNNPVCDFHEITNDSQSLKYQVSNYSTQYCGWTCTSCGIVSATGLLTEKQALYSINETFKYNITKFTVGGGGGNPSRISEMFNLSINSSQFVKSRLMLFGDNIATDQDYKQCVYFNGKFVGRACQSRNPTSDWQTCSYPLKPEWFVAGRQNVTISGGSTAACFANSGTVSWDFQDVQLSLWQSSAPINSSSDFYPRNATLGDSPYNNSANFSLNINVDKSQTIGANLELEAKDVDPDYYDCVYINNNYLGSIDYQKWNGTNVWQKAYFDVPVIWINNGSNSVNITSGTTSGCTRTSGTNDQWTFRKVNLSIRVSNLTPNYNRFMSMLVMSDGDANTKIGDCGGCDSAGAINETITKACEAKQKYGIGIFTVAFGNAGAVAIDALNKTACCDDCSHFYTSNNASQLLDIYTKIAQSIISINFAGQTINVTGTNILPSKLFPDSFIDFNYSYDNAIYQNKVPILFETNRFGNNLTTGYLYEQPNTTVSEAKVTSYSGEKWTDNLVVNGNNVFRLGDYDSNYQNLGDPFIVYIPKNNIIQGNNSISISTGLTPVNATGGSSDDKSIYILQLNGFSDYSNVVAKSEGCTWTINFEDGTSKIIKVPKSYSGTNTCDYANAIYDANDAVDNSVYSLFRNLDLDKNGKLDVNIDESNLDFNTLSISKVPSLWGPAIIEIRVWV